MFECKQMDNNDEAEPGHTYDEAVELTGHGRYNYVLLTTCCIISKAIGLDMFGFAIIVTVAKCDLNLGLTETGVLASAPFAGAIFVYPMGYYADTRGRKQTLLLSTFAGFVFASLSSLSPNWQLMMFLKTIASGFYVIMNTILGECTGSAHRSKYIFIVNSMNLLSDSIAFGLAYFLLPLDFIYPITFMSISFRPWRLLVLIMALPLAIGGLMMIYLYESPKFLASRGDNKKSLKVLKSIYMRNGGKENEYPVLYLKSLDRVNEGKTSIWKSIKEQTTPIFKPPLLWRTLQLTYLMIVCVCTNNAFVMWFPGIVNIFITKLSRQWDTDHTFCSRLFQDDQMATNYSRTDVICNDTISQYTIISGIIYSLFFGCMNLVFSRAAAYRRIVFIFWLAIACVSCLLVDLYQPVASLIFFVLLQTTAIGLPSLTSYFVDLYPTSCRGMVGSIGMTVTRLCSLGAVNLVGAVITLNCSVTFYAWAVFIFSGIVVALFLPSDNKRNGH